MITYKSLASSNDQVDCTGQRAVVSGGTSGIGSGIALRYALSGANVWIVGRSEARAKSVLDQLRLASAEGHRRRHPNEEQHENDHEFFQADMSRVEEVKRVAGEISQRAGNQGVDYLIETQGGPPNGKFKDPSSPASPEGGFAVQCGSRFGLAYHLTAAGTIKRGICMIASPGNGGNRTLDPDDLDLRKAEQRGEYKQGVMGIVAMGQQHASVLDAVAQGLAERHPNIAVTHMFPGLVGTDAGASAGFPTPFVWGSKLMTWLGIFSKPTIGSYPEVPFYVHANPEGKQYLRLGEANLLGPYLGRKDLSANVQDKNMREKILASLESMYK